jgi:hypothetical protein
MTKFIELSKNKLLNEKSLRFKDPPFSNIKLKDHQKAILYRLREIESKSAIGVMADIAGSGKSYCMIALILYEKLFTGKTQNLMITPYNIHGQWKKYIEEYSDKLKVVSFTDYAEISKLYHDKKILSNCDIMLTTPIYYNAILSALSSSDTTISRIIIDEIDSIEWFINKQFLSKKCWFISASFNPVKIGDYKIDHSVLPDITCKCEEEFILKGFPLPEPIIYNYINYREYVDVFSVFGEKQYKKIFMMDYFYNFECINEVAISPKYLLNLIIKDIKLSITNTEKILEQKSLPSGEVNKFRKKLNDKKILLEYINNKISNRLQLNIKVLKNKTKRFDEIQEYLTKIECFEKILDILKTKKNFKLIIFADNFNALNILEETLEEYGIVYNHLNGGNISDTEKIISSYRDSDEGALLVNSMLHGAGINLENTTDIIIMHKTPNDHQIIGRAQRPGRKQPLNIHNLIYIDENDFTY